MRAARRLVVGLVIIHGLVHLIGAAEGLGWAEPTRSKLYYTHIRGK